MPLSAATVVAAGTDLAARDGLGAVGIRSVAQELGVTPMALYRHVGDATGLRDAVVDQLLSDLPEVRADGPWDEACRAWAQAARQVLGRAPGLPQHVLLNWIHLPKVLDALDGLVGTLAHCGPPGCDPVAGANAVFMHALMRAQAEESVRRSGLQRDLSTLRSNRHRFPHLWTRRDEYRRARVDEHFAYGLDALLAGLGSARREG